MILCSAFRAAFRSSPTGAPLEAMTLASRHLAPAVILALVVTGCATGGGLRAGQQAERIQDYDRAVVEYTRALKLHPGNQENRLALERARMRAGQDHFSRGRRLSAVGKLDEA